MFGKLLIRLPTSNRLFFILMLFIFKKASFKIRFYFARYFLINHRINLVKRKMGDGGSLIIFCIS